MLKSRKFLPLDEIGLYHEIDAVFDQIKRPDIDPAFYDIHPFKRLVSSNLQIGNRTCLARHSSRSRRYNRGHRPHDNNTA